MKMTLSAKFENIEIVKMLMYLLFLISKSINSYCNNNSKIFVRCSPLAEASTHVMQGVHALSLQGPGTKHGISSRRGVVSDSRGRFSSLSQPGQAVDQRRVLLELVHALEVVLSLSHQVGLEVGAALRAGLGSGTSHPLVEGLHVVVVAEPGHGRAGSD